MPYVKIVAKPMPDWEPALYAGRDVTREPSHGRLEISQLAA